MLFRSLTIIFILLSQLTFAQGRKPAVEDFVGIEVEHPETTPQGTESLFNFEKEIKTFETQKQDSKLEASKSPSTSSSLGFPAVLGILFILGLPTMIWVMIMGHLKNKAQTESASNIEVLENYRRQRKETRKTEEEQRKAS